MAKTGVVLLNISPLTSKRWNDSGKISSQPGIEMKLSPSVDRRRLRSIAVPFTAKQLVQLFVYITRHEVKCWTVREYLNPGECAITLNLKYQVSTAERVTVTRSSNNVQMFPGVTLTLWLHATGSPAANGGEYYGKSIKLPVCTWRRDFCS